MIASSAIGLIVESWTSKIDIEVCIKGGECQFCGNPGEAPESAWVTVTCQGGPIQGNEIQLRNDNHHLQFCEMIIQGTRKLKLIRNF